MTGIISYGYYFPKYRIKTDLISPGISKTSGVFEKVTGGCDEDAVTVAVEAGMDCLRKIGRLRELGEIRGQIGGIYVGSESHPYAVKPTSSIVGQFLGISDFSFGADLEIGCKAGTSGLIAVDSLIRAGKIKYGLAIGADRAQGKPGDILEGFCACGGGCFLIGDKKSEIIAEIVDSVSFQTDTPDFWRRDGQICPSHGGRFSGEPAYFFHIEAAVKKILERNRRKIKDFSHIVFHQPNGKFPVMMAKKLGVTDKQFKTGLYVENFGNPYSASSLLGLCKVLEITKPSELILVASYGSGAGSDALIFKTTKNIKKMQGGKKFEERLKDKIYLTLDGYRKMTNC